MRGGTGEICKLLPGVPFDEQRDEVTNGCFIEPVVDRANGFLHCQVGHLRELRNQAINHLPDHAILFGAHNHTPIARHRRGFPQPE